jgi:hypothetical protein
LNRAWTYCFWALSMRAENDMENTKLRPEFQSDVLPLDFFPRGGYHAVAFALGW